ncbi:hypothetical protein V5O48_000835 [Marasmius crinis-equi]|uniref:RRM domain-containing protein n=1 Tax=Marasmius crinis-equi TaxID=585013 RepID=A0ABR3G0D6_9AGAR
MYAESAPPPVPQDPYSQEYTDAPPPPPPSDRERDRDAPPPPRGRSRSRSPARESGYRSPYRRRSPAPSSSAPRRPAHAPVAPNPSSVLGVFGLSIRTQERDLDEEFSRFGRVEKVTIVYDQRSDRSRGFGFIRMSTVEEATRCIQELNGIDLNGRRIRVDFSVTDRPHNPTPAVVLIGTAVTTGIGTVTITAGIGEIGTAGTVIRMDGTAETGETDVVLPLVGILLIIVAVAATPAAHQGEAARLAETMTRLPRNPAGKQPK